MQRDNPVVTIKEISKLAKVSSTTVSMVLNKKPGVGAETRERILRIAKALDYKPNLMARTLVSGHSGMFGMLITSTLNPVFPELAEGVGQVLRSKGYSLSIIPTNDNEAIEERELRSARARGFEGLITSSTLLNNRELSKLVESGFLVVSVLRRDYSCENLDYVVADDFFGGYLAVEHLSRLGYERIAIIRGPQNTSTGVERFGGGVQALADYGIQTEAELIHDGNFFMDSGYQAAKTMMNLARNKRPRAIYACNDEMAVGALEAFWEIGLCVPEDVALVGFNNTNVTSLGPLSISSIAHKKIEMGRLAAKRILERLDKKDSPLSPFQVVLEPTLVKRNTCGFKKTEGYIRERTKKRSIQLT